jgi:putative MATE family efflux protein
MHKEIDAELTKGSINSHILKLSFPTMVGMLLQAVYDIVDMAWIGFISPAAIAATTLFSTFFWLVEVMNEIVGNSSVSLISQSFGSGDLERTQLASEQTLIFKFLLATVGAAMLGFLLEPAFRVYTSDPEVIQHGLDYGMIRVVFIPVFFSSYSVNTIFRCTGDAKTPMKLLIGSALLNMVLDPLLMFDVIPGTNIRGLDWGMKGAAVATVASISLSFIVGFVLLLRGKAAITIRARKLFVLNKTIDLKLITVGLPSGLNLLLRNLSTVIFLKLVALYGTSAIAVVGVAIRVYSFSMMPGWGLMMGSGIIIGQNLGANKPERALQTVRWSTIDCMLMVGLFAIAMMVFPASILGIFMGGAEIPQEGISLLRIIGPSLLLSAAMSGIGAAFTGSGKNRPMLYASVISQWGFMVPYSLLVVLVFKLPIAWLWAAFMVGDGSEFIFRWIFFRKSNWLAHRV